MQFIQTTFYIQKDGLYATSKTERHPDFMWGNGILFPALLGATRNDPKTWSPITARFFISLDRYWDKKAPLGGYEPLPTRGGGNDKYYDDNAWMVLTFLEAYEMSHDRRYLVKAQQSLKFVLSGWDDQLGGGIWWHEGHKEDAKNTCVNAPAAVGCLRIARYLPADQAKQSIDFAKKLVDWTVKTFETEDGLFKDSIHVSSGKMNNAKLTYNTALMIRAFLGLYQATGDETYLDKAKRAATASDWFVDAKTGAYRDEVKWAHLLVEADLEMYRATGDPHLLKRATDNAAYQYSNWKKNPPATLIDNASIARTLWLFADLQSQAGQDFWKRMDHPASKK